jgi:hypothetical protein
MRITQQTDGSYLVLLPDADGVEHIAGIVRPFGAGYLAHPVIAPTEPGNAVGFAGPLSDVAEGPFATVHQAAQVFASVK